MRVLINALSVTNLSGRHVLLGHLRQLARWTDGIHHFDVLFHSSNRDIRQDLGENVAWVECPARTAGWFVRSAWEFACLPGLAKRLKSNFLFTPSGTLVPGLALPQVVFAQNPWALVRGLKRTCPEQAKASLQRLNYRSAVNGAAMMVFNSEYMRAAYRENAGVQERCSTVAYQALDDETHAAARALSEVTQRQPNQVLCVSAMARHKGVETLVQAVDLLRKQQGIPAKLILAGAWPDPAYQRQIRSQIKTLGQEDNVRILGHVSRQELYELYAASAVFSLMSHCESFGIPAVEAQVFGTPVVSSACCAIPEVCGKGGLYASPGDSHLVASLLAGVLSDNREWNRLSHEAVNNAARYTWDQCSRPLMEMFDRVAE